MEKQKPRIRKKTLWMMEDLIFRFEKMRLHAQEAGDVFPKTFTQCIHDAIDQYLDRAEGRIKKDTQRKKQRSSAKK